MRSGPLWSDVTTLTLSQPEVKRCSSEQTYTRHFRRISCSRYFKTQRNRDPLWRSSLDLSHTVCSIPFTSRIINKQSLREERTSLRLQHEASHRASTCHREERSTDELEYGCFRARHRAVFQKVCAVCIAPLPTRCGCQTLDAPVAITSSEAGHISSSQQNEVKRYQRAAIRCAK